MKKAILSCLLVIGLLGCKATLQEGGAYNTGNPVVDQGFFATDAGFNVAYSVIDAAFKFEQANRALLWSVSPQIKQKLDAIRPQAQQLVVAYISARDLFLKTPTVANKKKLDAVLVETQKLSEATFAILPQH